MERRPTEVPTAGPERVVQKPWSVPTLRELPKLTQLTLASAIGGGGGTGGGGSTVFALLLSLLLAGCHGESTTAPGDAATSVLSAPITCTADVAAGTVECGGPSAAADAIVGSQGRVTLLRSSNVSYNSGTETFQFDVTLQNLGAQTLGGSGSGTKVFFATGPTVTGGTGSATVLNADGTGTFTAADQPYFLYPDSLKKGATSAAKTWQLSMPPAVTSFTFTVLVSSWFFDESGVLAWDKVPGFSYATFRDLAVNSATDAMIVGTNGTVLRKVGTVWSTLPVQVTGEWVGVEAIGNGRYIAATSGGGVYRFNNNLWTLVRQFSDPIVALTAYADDRIAVSTAAGLDWYGANGWYHAGYGGAPHRFMGSYATNQGVAATAEGGLVRFNFNSPTPSGGSAVADVTALNSKVGTGFLYGFDEGGNVAGLWDDAIPADLLSGSLDIVIDAVAYGPSGTRWIAERLVLTGMTDVYSWSGGSWTLHFSVPDTILAMTEDQSGGMYLLAADKLLHWNGSVLDNDFVSPSGMLTAVDGAGAVAFVGTSSSIIWRYYGGGWTGWDLGGAAITDIAATGPNEAFAQSASGAFYTFNGAEWTHRGSALMAVPGGVAALGGGWAVAVGAQFPGTPEMVLWNGFGVNGDFGAGNPWREVWGSGTSEVRAVGDGGRIRRWNGASFSDANHPDTYRTLISIDGTSASDLWVGDTVGAVSRWNGSSWTVCNGVGPGSITNLWSVAPGMVYATSGPAGGVYAVTSSCAVRWLPIDSTAGTVTKLGGSSPDDVWAIVGGALYHGHR
jgi:hypothetical protein